MVEKKITAVILAAGEASRMGQPKQLLPWGDTTILGQTIRQMQQTAVSDILVVTGHEAEAVDAVARAAGVATVHNPDYATGEMLSSLQTAVRQMPETVDAVLIMLADQPMVEPETIDLLLDVFQRRDAELVAPTKNGRRGNPVLIGRAYFDELLALPRGDAPRTLLQHHADALYLVEAVSDAILRDLDRPEDYERWRPKRTS